MRDFLTVKDFYDFPMPNSLKNELRRMASVRRAPLSELHLRAFGRSSADFSGERVYFSSSPDKSELLLCLKAMCNGALYAYRDSIREGYITLEGGVRVGICADARYEGGRLVGIGDPVSLIYRIPTAVTQNADELYAAFEETRSGMLIYSPPGVGKTTALRLLSAKIGSGKYPQNVAVIDERREFRLSDYKDAAVDIFSGYKRADGMEIALRCASAEVIAVDEIGGRAEAEAMLGFLNSGVRIIATAHAGSKDDVMRRASLAPFFERGIFDMLAGISLPDKMTHGCGRVIKIERIGS